jgi:hypothetical protein
MTAQLLATSNGARTKNSAKNQQNVLKYTESLE